MGLTNWAGNITFGAARVHRPHDVDELRRLVAGSDQVRALGTGHSFNDIADTPGDLISVAGLPRRIEIDAETKTVTVSAGTRYGELAAPLHKAGYALANLGSLPHISVAGATATGTHGSGDRNGNLATSVAALELVTAAGDLITIGRADPHFAGSVIALGALGVVTAVTLDLEPTFDVAQYVYDDLPTGQLRAHFDEIFSHAYSVSAFTDWTTPGRNQVWLKRRVDADQATPRADWFGGQLADGPRHPVPGMSVVNCTEQLGLPGPWHTRLPHFRLEFTPSSGEELQTEYLVPRADAVAALTALDEISDRIAAVLQISEIRTVAADELWLSPSYRRDSVCIHFTWIKDTAAVLPVVGAIERQLAPYAARPHWGKINTATPEDITHWYDRLPDFVALTRALDPTGTFRNDWLIRHGLAV